MNLRQNTPQPADPLGQLNDPAEVFRGAAQVEFVRTLITLIRQAFLNTVMRDRAAPDFLLQSPAGKVYRVSVNDSGALVTTYVRG